MGRCQRSPWQRCSDPIQRGLLEFCTRFGRGVWERDWRFWNGACLRFRGGFTFRRVDVSGRHCGQRRHPPVGGSERHGSGVLVAKLYRCQIGHGSCSGSQWEYANRQFALRLALWRRRRSAQHEQPHRSDAGIEPRVGLVFLQWFYLWWRHDQSFQDWFRHRLALRREHLHWNHDGSCWDAHF